MHQRNYFFSVLGVASLISGTFNPAHASDRVTLNHEILERIQSVENGINRVRVYPSRRLVIQRSTTLNSETRVDDSVETQFDGKIRKDILGFSKPGKILAVEKIESFGRTSAPENTLRLVVSFDSDCTTRSCAFIFENPVIRQEYSPNRYHLDRSGTSFLLADFPDDSETPRVDALWIGHKPLFWRKLSRDFNVFRNHGKDFALQVKVDEIMNIERDTVRHDGWRE